jgi:hypothetical protein
MRLAPIITGALLLALCAGTCGAESTSTSSGHKKRNNLVTQLLDASSIPQASAELAFTRAREGWIFVGISFTGTGSCKATLDPASRKELLIAHDAKDRRRAEAVRYVSAGEHRLRVECTGDLRIDRLVVRAIPELIHSGLGFDPAIKSYGRYDLAFLQKDILPNVTTLIIPHTLTLPRRVIDDWHRQGKRFVAEVGIDGQARTAEDHFRFWASFLDKSPFLDGIIVNEFIVNKPSTRPSAAVSPAWQARVDRERQQHRVYEAAIKKLRKDARYKDKSFYAYVGGSGKKLNQEMIGPTFVRSLIGTDCRIALERYLHEMSSEKGSEEALATFVEGIGDWEAKEPGVRKRMVIVFGLFSMPSLSLNKMPNVDYHVWMDRQMKLVANHPLLADIAGLEWWTSALADEETVRFVGRLYRHYAIEGRTDRLTRDPLFTHHLRNADFADGLAGWTVRQAEEGTVQARRFPRYGRIEGRFMGLWRPPDPEHIGDTFLWMKRSAKGPNTFTQTIKDVQPGRLYSMKMFSCDYQDLVKPKAKAHDEATGFIGKVELEGVDVDAKRSFTEMYASSPEPRIPVWITYHWKVFRAKAATARIIVSDWPKAKGATGPVGQEQVFNFLEIQPYHE